VVIGQDDPDRPEPMRPALIEALLFESGVPVLLVPYIGVLAVRLEKVLVAWDGSATAARAVHAAMPLLPLAKEIHILLVDSGRKLAAESGTDLGGYLARHGLAVGVERIQRVEIGVADALISHVADNGFDTVVMGAYGHSRLRELVFGGATRDVLAEMTVPVLMAH
jgi:nucleotide-binding universal stress UspA family protein